jgi:hypothetical protein
LARCGSHTQKFSASSLCAARARATSRTPQHAYQILTANGVPKENIIVMVRATRQRACAGRATVKRAPGQPAATWAADGLTDASLYNHPSPQIYDDVARDPSNPFNNTLFNQPYAKGQPPVDVYAGCLDPARSYTGNSVTASNFLAVITGNKSAVQGGSGAVLKSDRRSKVRLMIGKNRQHRFPDSATSPLRVSCSTFP